MLGKLSKVDFRFSISLMGCRDLVYQLQLEQASLTAKVQRKISDWFTDVILY